MAILEQAKQLSGGKVFVVNWIAGIVHTEIPGFFGQRKNHFVIARRQTEQRQAEQHLKEQKGK